mmetsp:Transcript_56787/g.182450  ORF Transcript_56787/g.182450 Transcript_56787/m.182450 type:complete len:214 (+) Transcript_56787:1-642(+)
MPGAPGATGTAGPVARKARWAGAALTWAGSAAGAAGAAAGMAEASVATAGTAEPKGGPRATATLGRCSTLSRGMAPTMVETRGAAAGRGAMAGATTAGVTGPEEEAVWMRGAAATEESTLASTRALQGQHPAGMAAASRRHRRRCSRMWSLLGSGRQTAMQAGEQSMLVRAWRLGRRRPACTTCGHQACRPPRASQPAAPASCALQAHWLQGR